MTKLPMLRCYVTASKQSQIVFCCDLIFGHEAETSSLKKRSVIMVTCSRKVTSFQVRDYNLIMLIVP